MESEARSVIRKLFTIMELKPPVDGLVPPDWTRTHCEAFSCCAIVTPQVMRNLSCSKQARICVTAVTLSERRLGKKSCHCHRRLTREETYDKQEASRAATSLAAFTVHRRHLLCHYKK